MSLEFHFDSNSTTLIMIRNFEEHKSWRALIVLSRGYDWDLIMKICVPLVMYKPSGRGRSFT